MNVVPKNPADQIEFYAVHVPVWSEDPDAVGLSSAITEDLEAKLAAAKAAHRAALESRLAAEAATLVYRETVRALHTKGSAAIATIKAFADVHDDPAVHAKAQIPVPSTSRAERPAPGAPSISSITVDSVGMLNLEWNAAPGDPVGASSGIYFEVFRTRGGLGEKSATLVGTTAGLRLSDPDIGPGVNTYTVRARRGARLGRMSLAISITLPDAGSTQDGRANVRPVLRAAA